jgi:hypothetical protein
MPGGRVDKKNIPTRLIGTRFGNDVSYFEPGPLGPNWDIFCHPLELKVIAVCVTRSLLCFSI